jgi:ADP-heptose:LPS heptosyltransferase
MENIHRIAVFRALQLGDMLCAVPALRALRAGFPDAHITLIGLPWAKTFVRRYADYLDDFLEFPGYPGLPEQPAQIERFPDFLQSAQRRKYDLAIQLHGSGSFVNSIGVLLGARYNAGFFIPGEYCPDARLFLRHPDEEPEVRRMLRLMEHLGLPLYGDDLDFPIRAEDDADLRRCLDLYALKEESFVCVHPGARWPSRRWTPQGFAQVADRLSREGLQVVLTGTGDELELVHAVEEYMEEPYLEAAGRTTLGALALLLSRAKILVCNDTGISHIAAALKVPSVVVCLGSDAQRWAPLNRERHHVVSIPMDCRPCEYRICPIGHPCAQGLRPDAVISQALAVLSQSAVPIA